MKPSECSPAQSHIQLSPRAALKIKMAVMRAGSLATTLFVAIAAASAADSLPMKEPRLTEEQGKAQLQEFARKWHTRAEWEARAKNIREGILREAHLTPLPTRCPLKPIIWGKQVRSGYTVENVAFES